MKIRACYTCLFAAAMFMACAGQSYGQARATITPTAPGYTKMPPVSLNSIRTLSPSPVLVYPAGAATSKGHIAFDENGASVSTNFVHHAASTNNAANANSAVIGNGTLFGLDTVPTFEGAFAATGGPDMGNVFPYVMMGNDPLLGGRTEIPAKITTVSLTLLNDDGTVRATISYNPFEDITLDSPVFQNALYSDGRSQFTDAIQRAEFFNTMKPNWHTQLNPTVVNRVEVTVPRHILVQFPDGTIRSVQNYFFGTAPNGDHFVELLDLFFNSIFFNAAVNDINAGNYTTDAFNMQFYPNTFLFSIDSSGNPAGCCVLGFHNYIYEPGVAPEPRWIFSFSSWISPGLLGAGFQDVTALSHEVSEAFNDPFGDTVVPTWQFPNVPANVQACQGNLETGDPVEVLPDATVAIPLKENHKIFTFHPQTEALLQWFTQGPASNAIDGAFSYPDETALPHSALPCPPPPPPAP
ncbi:MAG TPA: hypothetical protein VJN90_01850 [Candidatus Acidoferrales bacterium]|nr:hypothetical protein [Candidatus Acidoferrales bacterium]